MKIDTIALDADDTLWHNETLFNLTQEKFRELLRPYHNEAWINKKLHETEMGNLHLFGYGVKGFMLSMIETAIQLTEGRIKGIEIQRVIDWGKEMLAAPVEPLPHVKQTLTQLSESFDLMVITKGDLFDQEAKVARSGLGDFFKHVEVVSDKNADVYRDLFARLGMDPKRVIMVGNSLKSDVLPLLELDMHAVHIPYHTTWAHERVPEEVLQDKEFHQLAHIGQLPSLIAQLNAQVTR